MHQIHTQSGAGQFVEMKSKTTLVSIILLACSNLIAQDITNRQHIATNDLPKLNYSMQWVVTTNWTPAGQSRTLLGWNGVGEDPNVTTYHERGTICSNLYLYVTWKGQVKAMVLETIWFAETNRSYTLETKRNYGQ